MHLDCLCNFATIAGSIPGSWALVGSHCFYLDFIESNFRRMCADHNRALFCNSVRVMFLGIFSIRFSTLFLTTTSAPMTTGTVCLHSHIFVISISISQSMVAFSISITVLAGCWFDDVIV